MTKLSKLIDDVVAEVVPVTEERNTIFEALKLEENFGNSKTIDLLDKYEKLIEGLIK